MTKHNDLVEMIARDLRARGYKDIHKYEEYNIRRCGEIDLYVKTDGYILLFEIKEKDSIRHYNKAKEQMHRAESNCFQDKRVFKFYGYGFGDSYKIEWVRRR